MKYRIFHIVLVLLLAGLWGCDKAPKKKTDWKVTLRKDAKNPYDTYLSFQSLNYYFPEAYRSTLYSNYDFSTINEGFANRDGHALVVISGSSVHLSKQEWVGLRNFITQGNEVMILAGSLDEEIQHDYGFSVISGNERQELSNVNPGSENVNALRLSSLPGKQFGFWGRNFKGYFEIKKQDSSELEANNYGGPFILGTVQLNSDTLAKPNFIQFSIGEGHLSLIATPLVLSNYFFLQQKNLPYLDVLWQSVPKNINHIYWMSAVSRMPSESSFAILWRNQATRWFIIVILIIGLIYLLFEIKRRQRIIPVIEEPVNSSAAFIETIGMLYFNKGDNANIALKMEQHFMEWVRNKCNINTNNLNDIFVQQLSTKAGMPLAVVQHLVTMIHELQQGKKEVSDAFLFEFYTTIQQFYRNNK